MSKKKQGGNSEAPAPTKKAARGKKAAETSPVPPTREAGAPDSGGADPTKPIGPSNPPRNRQFAPGQSGNPKGRPLGSKNVVTVIRHFLEMEEVIKDPLTKEQTRFCQLDIMTLALIAKARKGDVGAYNALLDRVEGKPKQTTAFEAKDGEFAFAVGFSRKDPTATQPPAKEAGQNAE